MENQEVVPRLKEEEIAFDEEREEPRPIYSNKVEIEQRMRNQIKVIKPQLRAQEAAERTRAQLNAIEEYLQVQQKRIIEIITYLENQDQQLADFQNQAMHKLSQNTKAALKQQLSQISKQTLKELKDIRNANTKILKMLNTQQKRIGKLESALEQILVMLKATHNEQ